MYDWVQSPQRRCLDAGSYTVRLTMLTRTNSRVDCLDLVLGSVTSRPTTWGRIKTLFSPAR